MVPACEHAPDDACPDLLGLGELGLGVSVEELPCLRPCPLRKPCLFFEFFSFFVSLLPLSRAPFLFLFSLSFLSVLSLFLLTLPARPVGDLPQSDRRSPGVEALDAVRVVGPLDDGEGAAVFFCFFFK